MSHATDAISATSISARIQSMAERPASITVRILIERRMAGYVGRDVALAQRLDVWRALLGDFSLEKIDSDVIHAARQEVAALPALAYKGRDHVGERIFKTKGRARKKSAATVNRYMAALSGLFTWAIAERLTPRGWLNPCRQLKRMPEPAGRVRFLENDDRERLLEACTRSKYPRLRALVLTAMLTGARQGELLGLRWRDVDLGAGRARLGQTKNGDRRTLILLPQVIEALRPFEGEPDRYVFGSPRLRHAAPASIDTAWRKAIARAQIDNFRFHDLRHCCASYLVQGGVDLAVVAEILGHRKLDMTRRYAHLKTETKAKAMHSALGSIGLGGS
jgi:integrase